MKAMIAMSVALGWTFCCCAGNRKTVHDYSERNSRPVEERVFTSGEGTELRLLMVKPDDWEAGQQLPALMWIHGGGFTGGEPGQYRMHMQAMADRGLVSFSVQYRLMKSRGYKWNKNLSDEENTAIETERFNAFMEGPSVEDCLADVADAVRYIRSNAEALGVDPNRIAVAGDSAGAYLCNALGTMVTEEARPNAVISCSSISDLTVGFGPKSLKPLDGNIKATVENDAGMRKEAERLSPVLQVPEDPVPWLVLHGTGDWLVGQEPKQLTEALREKGGTVTYKEYRDARHAFIVYGYSATGEQITKALLDIDRFLVEIGYLEGPNRTLAFPGDAEQIPELPVERPEGAQGLAYDCHGNFWTLVQSRLFVLPAQDPTVWQEERLSGLSEAGWRTLATDEFGHVWVTDGRNLLGMNPRDPQAGWISARDLEGFPQKGGVLKLLPATSGGIFVKMRNVEDVEVRWQKKNLTVHPPEQGEWPDHWELVGRLPGGTHDVGGDVLNGKFYMDWAITGEFGYPSRGRIHSQLLEFDPETGTWRIAGDYGQPRGYCAVGALDGEIWTVSGDALNEAGQRFTSTRTQIWNPETGAMRDGPGLPVGLPSALGLSSGGRLYVLGYPRPVNKEDLPLHLYSIGAGETEWTVEPQGPMGRGSSYGTEVDGNLYTMVDHRYLAVFDPESREWQTVKTPHGPRSPAVSHVNGEIWVMGGRNGAGEDAVFIYSPETGAWRQGPDLPREIMWGCAFHIDGDLYVTGGFDYRSFNDRTFRLRQE